MDKFSIVGPEPNASSQNTSGNSEALKDQVTADVIFGLMRLGLSTKLSSLRENYINKDVRDLIIEFIKKSLERIDHFIKYLKLKNWTTLPPLYPSTKDSQNEKVAANEISLLWEHLTYRYFNIRQTRYFISLSTAPDLKLILEAGLNILTRHTEKLEKKLLYFGVELPRPFSETNPKIVDTEIIDDRYIFNAVLTGMQDAVALHGVALLDIIVNDQLRDFFRQYLYDEIDYVERMIEYGKAKGWVFVPPKFRE